MINYLLKMCTLQTFCFSLLFFLLLLCFCLIVCFSLQRWWADGQIAAQSHQFPQGGSGETEAFGKRRRDKRCQKTFIFSFSCHGHKCHHPLVFSVDVKVMLTVRVNGWPVGTALTCIIHVMVFEEQLTGTGQVIITVRVSLRAPPCVGVMPVSLFSFYSLQRTIATKSRLGHPVKTEAALK